MAKKRGPDGIPVDTPSVKPAGDSSRNSGGLNIDISLDDTPTTDSNIRPEAKTGGSIFLEPEPPTVLQDDKGTRPTSLSEPSILVEEKTQINKGRESRIAGSVASQDSPYVIQSDLMDDPVAGWLVVISGPGQGNFLKLGYGQNSIGRGPNERISLNFGDSQISRESHAVVTYDPRGNQFYINCGAGSTNLTYLKDGAPPILEAQILAPGSHITLGDTTLLFVPFCGEEFTWKDME